MEIIEVKITHSPYPIYVGNNVFDQFPTFLNKIHTTSQVALITTKPIFNLHGHSFLQALAAKQPPLVLYVPDGEKAKTIEQVQKLYTELIENKFERNAIIIAFGGGVVGDLAGFVAATYLRGISFVQVPTTLLAQVDSSIGGKVGVNHPLGKNLIGAFKQPLFVFIDSAVLQTLPDAEIRCGLGEVIKYGLVLNKDLFQYLEQHLENAVSKEAGVLHNLVKTSAAEKAKIVAQDEQEKNLRMVLNFGHTFGHALEAEYHFSELKHGEAVILGMKCALMYAYESQFLEVQEFKRAMNLLNRVPVKFDASKLQISNLIERMKIDKKIQDGRIRLVLSDGIGKYRFEYSENTAKLEKAFQVLFN